MPAWPGVGRADDHRLLEALRRGGGDAKTPAALYDAYADRLSDYAYTLTYDFDAAARAAHDALVAACRCAGRLTEPARLRAWLYALTRFQCAAARLPSRRDRDATGPAPAEETADPPLAALVREALAEIGGREREVLELAARHGLTTAEIGSVLGLSSRQVSARLTRARDHLENAAAALVLARAGRAHCPDLSALVDHGVGAAWRDGPLGTAVRKRLSRHIGGCEICREGRARQVSAERLLDLIPIAFPPLSLRGSVIGSALRTDGRDTVTIRLDRRGFPVSAGPAAPETRPEASPETSPESRTESRTETSRRAAGGQPGRPGRARPRPLRVAPVMLAAACVFGTAGGVALVSGQAPAGRLEAVRIPPALGDSVPGNPVPGNPVPGDPVLGPGESDLPVGDGEMPGDQSPEGDVPGDRNPAPSDGSPQSAATAPPHPTPGRSRPSPTRAPNPAPNRAPNRVPKPSLTALCPGDLGTAAGAAITLAARHAAIRWTATASGGIAVSPRQGRLRAGASGRVTLAVVDPGVPGTGVVTFQSSAGRPACRVTWDGQEGATDADPVPVPTSGPPGPTTDPSGRPDNSPPPAADAAATPSP